MNLSSSLSINKSELLTGVLTFLFLFLATFGSRQFRLSSGSAITVDKESRLIIPERANLNDLSFYLDSLGVDFSKKELEWSSRMLGWRTFKKGSYNLAGEYSYEVFLAKLARGIQDPVPVVILPGINQSRFAESISNQIDVSKEEMLDIFTDSLFLDELRLSSEDLFGRMLPETYLMYWTSSPKDVVRRVLREFNAQVVDRFSEEVNQQDLTIDDVLTMASIVEWEANIEEEKPIISGLYWNRFNRGMRLQADPTINFALGERRRLLFEDYQFDHPYNTYLKKGLPPGPITNPSLSTIEASVFPQQHDYIYMVANPEGGHVFTRTFEEHQIESEKWRKWLRQQYRIKRQREAEEALNQ
ncbi:MAG: endolytic transglycosylase MltG [Balneolaceae bacterium]|nr:endolytic transglycosylase MltG [Balneolaceae bacterium]MBO6546250.1 endolytic transglycosylase MltG [Balneolaceae bacterium]MBO6648609.1 endolytic transglycosylase MltG [Balneolaceae bacterium]